MRRFIEEQIAEAHSRMKELNGDAWPDHYRTFFDEWRRTRVSLGKQSHLIGRLFGVDTCPSTVRNIQRRLTDDTAA